MGDGAENTSKVSWASVCPSYLGGKQRATTIFAELIGLQCYVRSSQLLWRRTESQRGLLHRIRLSVPAHVFTSEDHLCRINWIAVLRAFVPVALEASGEPKRSVA